MTLVAGHTTLSIPVLEADGLRLRAPKASDFPAYWEYCASERSRTVGGPYDQVQSMDRFLGLTGHWAYHGFGRWIIADGATNAPMGVSGLYYPPDWPEPEIAWTVFGPAEGQGVAYRAAQIVRRYAYEVLGWTTVMSAVDPNNTRSVALAKRMGAHPDGSFDLSGHGPLTIWRHPAPAEVLA